MQLAVSVARVSSFRAFVWISRQQPLRQVHAGTNAGATVRYSGHAHRVGKKAAVMIYCYGPPKRRPKKQREVVGNACAFWNGSQ